MWIHAHLSSRMNLVGAYMLHRKKTKEHENTSLGKNCCMMSVHWHHTEWERIPGCIALVIFSSNRTGYHPHSQHCWRVCAPFRADLNKTGKLTQSLLRCMNINVTSDRVEWQTRKYRFIMSSRLGQTISVWTYLMFFPIWAWMVYIFS